jgi:hypothetical protein
VIGPAADKKPRKAETFLKITGRGVAAVCLIASLLSLVGCASVAEQAGGRSTVPGASEPALAATAQVRIAGGAGGLAWKLDGDRLAIAANASRSFADVPLPVAVTPAQVEDISSSGTTLWLAAAKGNTISVYRRNSTASTWRETVVRPSWPAGLGLAGAPDRSALEAQPGLLTLITSKIMSPTKSANELWVSTDGGSSFTLRSSQLSVPWWQASFASAGSGVVIGGPAHNLVFHTGDGGASWLPARVAGLAAGDPVTFGTVIENAGDLELPATVLVGQGYLLTIYLSHDGGESFVAQPGPGLPLPTETNAMAVAGSGASLWAAPGSGGELFTSSDAGRRWSRIASPSLPSGVMSISIDPSGSGTALVQQTGCRSGKTDCYVTSQLYATADGGSHWTAS